MRHDRRRAAPVRRLLITLLATTACGGDNVTEPEPARSSMSLERLSVSFNAMEGGDDPTPAAITISNAGERALTGLDASVAYGNGSGWLDVSLDAASAPANLTLAPKTSSLAPGVYEADVTVSAADARNSPQTVAVSLTVQEDEALLPDLTVDAPISVEGPVEAGGDVDIGTVTIRNVGTAPATSIRVGMFLSPDATITSTDQSRGVLKTIPSLPPGASVDYEHPGATIPAGMPPGDYHFGVLVDHGAEIAEADESNNFVSAPLTVTSSGSGTTTYTLAIRSIPSGAGTVQGAAALSEIAAGEQVTLTAVAETGYEFAGWSGDADGTESPLTVTMDRDRSIQANFERVPPELEASATDGEVAATWTYEWPCDNGIGGRGCLASSLDHYELEESATSSGAGYRVVFTSSSTRASPFSRTFERTAGTYHYRVRALGNGWASPYSDPVTVIVAPSGPTAPAAPSNLAAQVSGADVRLTWSDDSNDETGFTIQWSRSASFSGAGSLDVAANLTTFDLFDDEAPDTWYMRIRAFNAAGPSAWSNTVEFTTTVPTTRLNFVNASSYPVISVQVDGVEQLTTPGSGILPGTSAHLDVAPGTHQFYMANGRWEGGSRFTMYTFSGNATVQAGQTVDVTFESPTIGQLLTRFGSQAYWDGDFIVDGNIHFATLRFSSDGGWVYTVDGNPTRNGSYSLAGRYPGGQFVEFNLLGWTTGTLWETLGFISIEVEPGIFADLYPR